MMALAYETVRVIPFENDSDNAALHVAHGSLTGAERYRITSENDQWWMANDSRIVDVPLSVVREYAAAMEEAALAEHHLKEACSRAKITAASVR